jgi:LPS-assembly lipoprotein
MWWPERRARMIRRARPALALIVAGLLAGCFQPLYGERTVSGDSTLRQRLSAIEVVPITAPSGTPAARVAVELRNALIFDFTGGAGLASPTHRLNIQLISAPQQVIVDVTTSRPDVEEFRVTATYTLTELATGKVVANGRTFGLASYDIPGQQQRFARARGQRDAQDRAVQVIAEGIRTRLASYFIAGT